MKIKKWIEKNCQSLEGQTVLVTGSTGVLGAELCKVLAKLGANLILANRNQKLTAQQIEDLKSGFPNVKINFVKIDMLDIESVKNASNDLQAFSIDKVILNAGAYKMDREKTALGFDKVFQINFVSPYIFVKSILPVLEKSKSPLVVDVGSIAHKRVRLNQEDVDFSCCKKSQKVYGNAKRFLMLALAKLLKKTKTKYAVAHPGVTPTNITRSYPKFLRAIIKLPMKIVFTSPKKACLNIVKALFEECGDLKWFGPRVADIWGYPKLKRLKTCSNDEAEKYFEIAEKLIGEIKIV